MSDTAIHAEPLVGRVRTALNQSDSSIHDPEAAKKLGFRGAAVGGNNHLDLFAPLLVETYGQQWFERGPLSVYFQNVVMSRETVQAVVERPSPAGAQTRIHARRADDPAPTSAPGRAETAPASAGDPPPSPTPARPGAPRLDRPTSSRPGSGGSACRAGRTCRAGH